MVAMPMEYTSKKVTAFGGMRLMKDFSGRLGIGEYLQKVKLPSRGSYRAYHEAEIVLGFWLSIWTRASRSIHAVWLRHAIILQKILGLSQCHPKVRKSFFKKINWARNTKVFPELARCFVDKIDIGAITIDLDSTIITPYDEQEGAKKG
jgi:hypothetical protein